MRMTRFAGFWLVLCVTTTLFLSSCSSAGKSVTTMNNPAPSVTGLLPAFAPAGAAAQTLTINGSNFLSSSTVTYNNVAHTTTFVNSTTLTIPLTAADQAIGGSFAVVVTNPPPGGGNSSANFAVDNPVPQVTGLTPAFLTAGTPAQALTINGTGFVSTSSVTFNGNAKAAAFVNATTLTIPLTATDLGTIGIYPVLVTNAAPGGGNSSFNFNVTAANANVAGIVFKSGVTGATVTITAVNADGTNGATAGTCLTDANGNFTCTLNSLPSGSVRACAAGGTYTSEFDGSTITSSSQICALIDQVPDAGLTGLSITPISDFVNSLAVGDLSSGKASSLVAAHAAATTQLDTFYGLTPGVHPEALTPKFGAADITGSPDAFKMGAVLSSYTLEGESLSPTDPDALIAALSADISDGVWDGKSSGTPITLDAVRKIVTFRRMKAASKPVAVDGTTENLDPLAGTSEFVEALLQCLDQAASQTPQGLPVPPGCQVFATLSVQALAAVEQAIQLAAGANASTPAYANLTPSSAAVVTQIINGTQYLFVAAGVNGIAVYDFSNPNQPVLVNLWPQIAAVVGAGGQSAQVTGLLPVEQQSYLLAFSFYGTGAALLDSSILALGTAPPSSTALTPGTNDPVLLSATLPITNQANFYLSSAPSYIQGATLTTNSIYANTGDGYYVLTPNFNAGSLTGTSPTLVPVTDPNQQVGMQMAVDPALNLILIGDSSGYSTPSGGVQLIDVSQTPPVSYYWDDTTAASFPAPTAPDGIAPPALSGSAIDTNYGVGILTYEGYADVTFLNLANTQKQNGTGGNLNTFSIPPAQTAQVTLASSTSGLVAAGSFVDSSSHLAMFMAGDSTEFAVGALQAPSTSPWLGLSDWRFWDIFSSYTSIPYFVFDNEPFSAGIVTSQVNNQPYGYIVDGSGLGVVQVSMSDFVAMQAAGTSGDPARTPNTDPAMTNTTNTAAAGSPSNAGPILQELYFFPSVVTALTVNGPTQAGPIGPCSSSLSLSPATCTVTINSNTQFTVTLTFADGSQSQPITTATTTINGVQYGLTWTISGGDDGEISPTGVFTAGPVAGQVQVTLEVSFLLGNYGQIISATPYINVVQ